MDFGRAVVSDMPSVVQPQKMYLKAQGKTPYTHYTTKELADRTYQPGAVGIFIPAHFADFVVEVHNNTPVWVSYYLAHSEPIGTSGTERPGVFYPFTRAR